MNQNSVLIGMSGGVDSSVAAHLLEQQGYACIGCTMKLYCGNAEENVRDARAVAERMGIPFHVFDLQQPFHHHVIRNFIACYESGRTPNPCIECNRHLKFGSMLEKALELGCTHIATGHYAQIPVPTGQPDQGNCPRNCPSPWISDRPKKRQPGYLLCTGWRLCFLHEGIYRKNLSGRQLSGSEGYGHRKTRKDR